jgi:site-specific recombinase XerC
MRTSISDHTKRSSKGLEKTRIKLGLKDLRWYDLRHEAASRFFECSLNPLEVAAITGHGNLNTLRRYTHLNPQDLAKNSDNDVLYSPVH